MIYVSTNARAPTVFVRVYTDTANNASPVLIISSLPPPPFFPH